MESSLEVFLSNRLEILYQQLKKSLFHSSLPPLKRRIILVYGPAMKNWINLRMAQDPELKIAMGLEFLYFGQAFENLLHLSTADFNKHFPSVMELSFAIEAEVFQMMGSYSEYDPELQSIWRPVMQHLGGSAKQSSKMEKRLISFSDTLARLFHDYGKYAPKMIEEWETFEQKEWQPLLWRKLFLKNEFPGLKSSDCSPVPNFEHGPSSDLKNPVIKDRVSSLKDENWTYQAKSMKQEIEAKDFSLFVFSISAVIPSEFDFLHRLSHHQQVQYFLLSPCAVFWSDIRSDKEKIYLEKYWEKKLGDNSPQVRKLEEILRDRNPLLANFGRIGREMASHIEESGAQTHACYVLSDAACQLDENLCFENDLILTNSSSSLTLLQALQADLLLMRSPQDTPPFNFENDHSVQLHIAPNKRREVEILYHNILKVISEDPCLLPNDVIVMAPQIGEYASFIQSVFGNKKSQLDFQILDLPIVKQSEIFQGFHLLIKVSEGRWDANEILELFSHPAFQRSHQLSTADFEEIKQWIEKVGIRWGEDKVHRNDVLEKRHCRQGMVEETIAGTWDFGLTRLIRALVEEGESRLPVDFSDTELLGKWISLFYALRDDLSPLQDKSSMTVVEWTNYLNCLLEVYLKPDFENEKSLEEYNELKSVFELIRGSSCFMPEVTYPFNSVKQRLIALISDLAMPYRSERLHSIRFSSLMTLRSIPAKVIAILGMQENAFPRLKEISSLNKMNHNPHNEYCPSPTDYDRYLFLEVLQSAENCLLFSYCASNHKEAQFSGSILIEELFSYLDKMYTIRGKKISDQSKYKHPLDSFDSRYFIEGSNLSNFSSDDYQASLWINTSNKYSPSFIQDWKPFEKTFPELFPSDTIINIKHLARAAKDPIRFHFNKGMEIYLTSRDERELNIDEPLYLDHLDHYLLKQRAIKGSVDSVWHEAETEGILPFGVFKEVAKEKIKRDAEKFWDQLSSYSLTSSDLFEIEFTSHCTNPFQIDRNKWVFPPVKIENHISIVGKIQNVTYQGLIINSKDTLSEAWKVWPCYLLYCCGVKKLHDRFNPNLIFLESQKIKEPFFESPYEELKKFTHYYAVCCRHFSPLMPDWISYFLNEDPVGLEEKIKNSISEAGYTAQNEYLKKIFNNDSPPDVSNLVESWKNEAKLLAGHLVQFWGKTK